MIIKTYAELLKEYIEQSGYKLEAISRKLHEKGLSASLQYLSRLQNGKASPASDELNRALCEITGGNVEELLLAAHIERAPAEIKPMLLEKKHERIKNQNVFVVAGQEIELTQEEALVFNEMRKHPKFNVMFHDIAKNPEKKIKTLVSMWEFIKSSLEEENDNEDPKTGFGELNK
jgi:transcriptional regulator with XRE-family HTH domain